MKKSNNSTKNNSRPTALRQPSSLPHDRGLGVGLLFFLLSLLWASWWMGDVFRIAYERSFIVADSTLMFWLWQKSFGWLWIIGRALLIMYRWKIVGGLLVAVLLTVGSWLFGYCLRLPQRWRILQFLPASLWMLWTAKVGLNRDLGRNHLALEEKQAKFPRSDE